MLAFDQQPEHAKHLYHVMHKIMASCLKVASQYTVKNTCQCYVSLSFVVKKGQNRSHLL